MRLPGRGDLNAAVTRPCRPQLYASIKLPESHSTYGALGECQRGKAQATVRALAAVPLHYSKLNRSLRGEKPMFS